MQPITKLGTINALRGLKRPQKTVVRLRMLLRCGGNLGFRLGEACMSWGERLCSYLHIAPKDPLGPPFLECEVFLTKEF